MQVFRNPIRLIPKNRFPLISTRHDMVKRSPILDPNAARHFQISSL